MQYYLDMIQLVREKDKGVPIQYNTLSIESIVAKYSNTKQPIYKLVIDNKPISRNNNYIVKYQCATCNAIQEISLNLFTRKMNKGGKHCHACVNNDEKKRTQHSEFMCKESKNIFSGSYSNNILPKKMASLQDALEFSENDWKLEDDEFKKSYFLRHLTVEDFNRIKIHIKSVGNGKIILTDDWSYFPYYRVYNQTRYTPMLINMKENQIDKLKYITIQCENCESSFVNRDIEVQKNRLKLLCNECSFSNRTFKMKHLFLKNGDRIIWQSIQERRFIEWCDNNNINIKNGPCIEYTLNDRSHTYRVDFELPDKKLLIEIKDNHIWHKQQMESGKFNKKVECAKNWCVTHNYKYIVIFPKIMSQIKEQIVNMTL